MREKELLTFPIPKVEQAVWSRRHEAPLPWGRVISLFKVQAQEGEREKATVCGGVFLPLFSFFLILGFDWWRSFCPIPGGAGLSQHGWRMPGA